MRAGLVWVLLLVGACQPQAKVIGGVDLSGPVRALGTEPFWGVAIDPIEGGKGEIVFTGIDRPDFRAPNPGARIEGEIAVFEARDAAGLELTVKLRAVTCSDGLSDFVYPLVAEVTLGRDTLKGCAASQTVAGGT